LINPQETDMKLRHFTVLLVLAAAGLNGHTADTTPPEPTRAAAPDPLAMARARIQAKQWPAAIEELQKVNATASADWNNLMGYAQRKQATPDLAAAQRYYDAALRINPRHLGALEYAGELALMKGELPVAEAHLATLEKACRARCEEFDDLKGAIARYKASGNRWVP
jgi:tetratricopeptide (TPR) repeat protein